MSRWNKLVELAEERSEKTAREMADLQQKISAVENQRQQMEDYRQEYAQRAAEPGTVGTIQQLKTIRQFGDQVQVTVGELEARISSMQERYETIRQAWHKDYQRERALKALQGIEERKIAYSADKAMRRDEDDYVLQARRRRDTK